MIDGDICNFSMPAQEISTLSMNVHDRQNIIILEGIEPPPLFWNARFWGLAVLDDHSSKGISIF